MNNKRLIYDQQSMAITINRLCFQLIEDHHQFVDSVILGLQPKGIFLADKIQKILKSNFNIETQVGYLDITFNRDDFRRRDLSIVPSEMKVPFSIENKKVILIDDVLYSGRTIRAALDSMLSFGRPASVDLLVLINRKYTRELPIEPKYVGKSVNTLQSEKVLVELVEQDYSTDAIWLVNKENSTN